MTCQHYITRPQAINLEIVANLVQFPWPHETKSWDIMDPTLTFAHLHERTADIMAWIIFDYSMELHTVIVIGFYKDICADL